IFIHHRIGWIGNELAEAFPASSRLRSQFADSLTTSCRRKEELSCPSRRRPYIRVAPLIRAHHEIAHGLFALDAILDAFEIVIHPAQHHIVIIDCSRRSKLALARLYLARAAHPMHPRTE